MPVIDNVTEAVLPPPAVHMHLLSLPHKHSRKYHHLTSFYDPQTSGFLSAESAESAEVVVVSAAATAATTVPGVDAIPAADSASAMETSASDEVPLLVVKRDVADAAAPVEPITLIQLCPGRVRFF